MTRLSQLCFAGLAAMTILGLHISSAAGQQSHEPFLSFSPIQQATTGVQSRLSTPFLLVQGRHYSEYGRIPPRPPDFRGYYGYDLPAYPPYAKGLPLRDYIPYGWYDYLLRHLDRHDVCPPWTTFPYEC